MKNKILIPLLILGGLATFFSFKYTGDETENSVATKRKLVMETVVKAINQGHFSPRVLDDSFSAKVFDKMLNSLDYQKKFFTQQDVAQLNKYKFTLDDDIKTGTVDFFDKANELFLKRLPQTESFYKDILATPFNFNTEEQVMMDGDKIDYTANEAALKERWRLYLKYQTLAKYVDLKKDQEKKKDTMAAAKLKTDVELEADARKAMLKNYDNYYKRLKKIKDDDRFAMFVNSVTTNEDPHTDYFPPRDKQRFDEQMSGTFFGIGAQLKDEDGKVKVAGIVAGSPCWKQGELKQDDEITKVAQGPDEPVDIQGMDIDDVVQLIRGKKGSEVRLTVKKVNGAVQVIPIIRGEVLLEEVFAKSALIDTKGGQIGYIYLPEFYADFQHSSGRRCAEDVAIEIMKLKNAGVKGIILDLRNNTGGSLSDVVDMAGLFIDQGPIVQVRSGNDATMALRDQQSGTLYDGPLAIMVNQNSASASEIMAAALQDYKRAIIVGSPTYGKGTVQQVKSLGDFVNWSDKLKGTLASGGEGEVISPDKLGSIKLTIQKFYRVNGGSTQLKGVTPDISFPDPYELIEMGERRDKAALKWDEIPAANYTPVPNPVNTAALAANSKKRVAANATFGILHENAIKLKKQEDDDLLSLNETKFRKEQEEANMTTKKLEELEKKATPLTFSNLKDDLPKINLDSTTITKNNDWIKNLKKDIYISETVNIVNDMTNPTMKVSMNAEKH